MTLKLGVPSKGRLMEKTFDWFAERGISLRRTGSEREYAGAVDGVDGIELVLLSAGEIPRELAAGRIHLGVTRTDLVREKLADWTGAEVLPWLAWPYGEQTRELRELARELGYLGFGQQSGALDANVDWQNSPRIPVNRQYAGWSSLREKLLALPFPLRATLPEDGVTLSARPELTLVLNGDWRGRQVQCFIGGKLTQPTVHFSDGASEVILRASSDIPVGRSRYNCTAFAGDGRYYWYSRVWMRRTESGWYPE